MTSVRDGNAILARPRSAILATLVVAIPVAGLLVSSLGLSAGADVMSYSSGIIDADVFRVVRTMTAFDAVYRTTVHPLFRVFVTPLGAVLRAAVFTGPSPLAAARAVSLLGILLQALLAGVLARQISRSWWGLPLATGLFLSAFSAHFFSGVPETGAVSGIATLLPLVLLGARREKPFTWKEVGLWGGVGVVCAGITITQVVHFVIGLVCRVALAPARRTATRMAAIALAVAVALTLLGVAVQSRLTPGYRALGQRSALVAETSFMRLADLESAPLAHVSRLGVQFFEFPLAAPAPRVSRRLIDEFGLDYFMLTYEDFDFGSVGPARGGILALTGVLMVLTLVRLRSWSPLYAAPLLSLLSQLGLHAIYGRDYLLFSLNWLGVLVALVVAAVLQRSGRSAAVYVGMLVAVIGVQTVNSVTVMNGIYREVRCGLAQSLRTPDGVCKAPLEPPNAEADVAAGLDAFYAQEDDPRAAAHYRRALAIHPGHYGATFQLAKTLDHAGEREEATTLWREVLAMSRQYQDAATEEMARARLAE